MSVRVIFIHFNCVFSRSRFHSMVLPPVRPWFQSRAPPYLPTGSFLPVSQVAHINAIFIMVYMYAYCRIVIVVSVHVLLISIFKFMPMVFISP